MLASEVLSTLFNPTIDFVIPEVVPVNVLSPAIVCEVVEITPLAVALASGTFKVITGVVVLFATDEFKSVPLVPKVKAATLVTVPLPPPPVEAIVIIPSAVVPVVVKVILLPSTNFILPPVADKVAVCEVESEVFANV